MFGRLGMKLPGSRDERRRDLKGECASSSTFLSLSSKSGSSHKPPSFDTETTAQQHDARRTSSKDIHSKSDSKHLRDNQQRRVTQDKWSALLVSPHTMAANHIAFFVPRY